MSGRWKAIGQILGWQSSQEREHDKNIDCKPGDCAAAIANKCPCSSTFEQEGFSDVLEKKIESKRERAGKSLYHLAAAAAGLGGEGIRRRGGEAVLSRSDRKEPYAMHVPEKTVAEAAFERLMVRCGLICLAGIFMFIVWVSVGLYALYIVFSSKAAGGGAENVIVLRYNETGGPNFVIHNEL